MIRVVHKGSFKNTERLFDKALRRDYLNVLNKYGEQGVNALRAATPVNSGITADSWSYEIHNDGKTASISFNNSSENNGCNVVVLLMYGHGTNNGGYVQANNFVDPALEGLFGQMADEAWKEVTK